MSAPRKPNASPDGKPIPSATQLKELPLPDREAIYAWCNEAGQSLTDVRAKVREVYGISLSSDSQLSRFRNWHFQQLQWAEQNDQAEWMEEQLKQFNPDASLEKIRQFTIATVQMRALRSGNDKMALMAVDRDLMDRSSKSKAALKREELDLNREKFAYLQKTLLEKAMDALFAEVKGNPPALEAFKRFKESISAAQATCVGPQ